MAHSACTTAIATKEQAEWPIFDQVLGDYGEVDAGCADRAGGGEQDQQVAGVLVAGRWRGGVESLTGEGHAGRPFPGSAPWARDGGDDLSAPVTTPIAFEPAGTVTN
jgi:hypothetical protein